MELSFVNKDEIDQALKEVRTSTSEINWVCLTYENAKSMKLKLLGKGTGGADELSETLTPEIAGYGIVRVVDKIDDSETVKFAYIFWLGEKLPRMQRARISVHQHSAKDFIGSELSNTIVMSKVMVTSGTASRVIDENAGTCIGDQSIASAAGKDSRVRQSKKDEIAELSIQPDVSATVASIRSDSDPLTWGLFEYDGATLSTAASGEGTVDSEVVPQLRDTAILYLFYRTVEVIDESETVKFAFITWNGPSTPRMVKAKLCGHSAAIDDFFHPYHVVLHCDRPDEVSDAIIAAAISKASGTADYTLTAPRPAAAAPAPKKADPAPAPAPAAPKAAAPAAAGGRREYGKPVATPSSFAKTKISGAAPSSDDKDGLPFVDREACEAAIRDVRNDESETTWAVVGIPKGKKAAELFGSGKEFDELMGYFKDDVVAWAILRRILVVDESETVKFVYIAWTGEGINRMLRARLGTWSGQAQELFSPYHVDIKATDLSEVTLDIITNAIETAAGRKVHVLE